MIDLQKITEEVTTLPPFKETILRASKLLSDSDVSAKELAAILRYDVGVTTNILKICNSAYYGVKVPVTNLQQAIVNIGHHELKNILIISGTMPYFTGTQSGYEGEYGELLRHSIATALLARRLGDYLDKANETLFLSGLLHDVGKLILGTHVTEEYQAIIDRVHHESLPFHQVEKEVLGFSHDEVGGMILKHWNFPEDIIAAVSHHHTFDVEKHSDTELIIALSDTLSNFMGTATFSDGVYYSGFGGLTSYFRLRLEDIETILSHTVREFMEILDVYSDVTGGEERNNHGV